MLEENDYEAIANAFKKAITPIDRGDTLKEGEFAHAVVSCIIYDIGEYMEKNNPLFDAEQFYVYCGL